MAEVQRDIELEIAYVLFVDIVGYSKLVVDQQRKLLELLNKVVRGAEQFRKAETSHRLITIPTGDGMALVFYNTPEAPVKCALEISRATQAHPELQLRMGVHSGAVSGVIDVSGRANIAGAGINIAQRVMDCGNAGHILLSKHVAEDLEQLGDWKNRLHDLGEIEVKHGARISVVNLYTDELGNPEVPQKFLQARQKSATPVVREKSNKTWIVAAVVGIIIAALAAGAFLMSRRSSPLTSSPAPAPAASAGNAQPGPAQQKSIAVLPFENLSSDKENAYFTDGVQDEILTNLARIADLKVISRTSVMQYKTGTGRNLRDIGQQLGVAHLVEGSVQRAANKVRVNAQLIDARNDAHLWAQTYDRDLADVFAIQSEIAKGIADQLQAKLSPNEKAAIEQAPTNDVVAFDLYTRAKTLLLTTAFSAMGRENVVRAEDLLNQALARDPSFFQAYCLLVEAHDQRYYLIAADHTPARLAAAETALAAAFRLRPDAGEAHLARATHLYRGYLNYDGALAELEVARKTLPNDPRVFELAAAIARRQGKREEGLRNYERALELDPRNFYTLQQISFSYMMLGRYSDVAAVLDRALSIKPDDIETKVTRAGVALNWKADPKPLHQTIEEIRQKDPEAIRRVADAWFLCSLAERDPIAAKAALTALGDNTFGDNTTQLSSQFGQGLIARMMKDEAGAHAAFEVARVQQEKIVQQQGASFGPSLVILGLIDAGLGRKEEALREGRRAVELMPVSKDALNGPDMIQYLAVIAAWVGDKDLAIEQLTKATQLTNFSISTYGTLKLLPFWDPLRGDPRFEKIVTSLAPK